MGMAVETTYSKLRENLSATLDTVVDDQEVVIVRRRGGKGGSKDVALLPATELASLLETAHLMNSPRNAQRLLTALRRAEKGGGKPQTVASLRKEMGLGQ
jgi:antitoxin YefM